MKLKCLLALAVGLVVATMCRAGDMALSSNTTYQVVYEGYALDAATNLLGTIRVKAAKPKAGTTRKISATALLLGEKKLSFRAAEYATFTNVVISTKDGLHSLALDLRTESFTGKLDGKCEVRGLADFFVGKDEESKRRAMAWADWKPVSVVALDTPTNAPVRGWSALSVKVSGKGKAKATGVMADGTKVSASAKSIIYNQGARIEIPVVAQLYQKKAGGFAFMLNITNGVPFITNATGWNASVSKKNPFTTTFATNVTAGVREPMDGTWKFSAPEAGVTTPVAVTSTDGKWKAEKKNAASLKLSYAKRKGLFKGSFKGASGKATVNGAVVDQVGYGTAVIKNGGSCPAKVEVAK